MEFPICFEERMLRLLGDGWQAFAEAFSRPLNVRGIRANTLKCTPHRLAELLPYALKPSPFCTDGFVTDAVFRAGSDPLHHAGAYYMQEPSAMSAVTVLAPQPGERVLDLCAAPGGKSTQIAAALQGQGLLWCNEFIPARARVLAQNIERCGVRNAVVSCADTALLADRLPEGFDAVLADIPCSGEGMFRKEAEACRGWSEDNIVLCAMRGQKILSNAARCVRPGGRLLLSTCTFAPEENEGAVVQFLHAHPDFSLIPVSFGFGRPGFDAQQVSPFLPVEERTFAASIPLTYTRRILPTDGGEGHFLALMQRAGDAPAVFSALTVGHDSAALSAARDLYASCFLTSPTGIFAEYGDTVRLLPEEFPATSGLHILAAGVTIATVHTGRVLRVEPTHALFQSSTASDCRRLLSREADDPLITAFLHGEELAIDGEDGWTGVAVSDIVTGFGKTSGNRLKNRYPKGLRLLDTVG